MLHADFKHTFSFEVKVDILQPFYSQGHLHRFENNTLGTYISTCDHSVHTLEIHFTKAP